MPLFENDLQLRLECPVARPIRPVAASRFNHDDRDLRYRVGARYHPRDILRCAPNRLCSAAALACELLRRMLQKRAPSRWDVFWLLRSAALTARTSAGLAFRSRR